MNQKIMKKLLNESVFDRKKPGLLLTAMAVSNIEYLILRVKELMDEIKIIENKDEKLKLAISLLLEARVKIYENNKL